MRRFLFLLSAFSVLFSLGGCLGETLGPADVRMFRYHGREARKSIELFTTRLYSKNPKYESNPVQRQKKLNQIFHGREILSRYAAMPSNEILTEVFAQEPYEQDRVFLLGLGLARSIQEVYGTGDETLLVLGLQGPLEKLKRLHLNLSQVNWRLKTYRDMDGELFFRSNEAGEDGYVNMGYEVIMTEVMTMLKDDIYIRGGLPGKYIFDMSTLFVSLIL